MEGSFKNFTLLHNHLLSILTTNNYQQENLGEKALQYVGMIVESERAQDSEEFFDYFCEKNGNSILKVTLEVDPLLGVKCLSLLLINLKKQHWISYLLCQPILNDAIQPLEAPLDEEWAVYFISFLKSLSIRIHADQISLFYNKKCCKFPLVYEALKYYNHHDCMVRTNVMNIILGVMKIKEPRLCQYFSGFPFTSYILTYCCEIYDRIHNFNKHLLEINYKLETSSSSPRAIRNSHRSVVKMFSIDLCDYICYLDDLMAYGSEDLTFFIRNSILSYIVMPCLKLINSQNPKLLIKSSIYLIFNLVKYINDTNFKQTVCLLLLGKHIPKPISQKLQTIATEPYFPKVYSQNFDVNHYYWNKFQYQIQEHCLQVFKDIENFQTDHQEKQQNLQKKQEFSKEIETISQFLCFDILNYSRLPQNKLPTSLLPQILNMEQKSKWSNEHDFECEYEINPVRVQVRKAWEQAAADPRQDDIVTAITTTVLFLIRSDVIENKTLKFCGILLPRLDTVHYSDQFNINSLGKLKQRILKTLHSRMQAKSEHVLRLSSLRNLLSLLDEGLYKRLCPEEEAIFHRFYTHALYQFKEFITKKNMKEVVENFEFLYGKWWRECFLPDTSISPSLFWFSALFGKDNINADLDPQFIHSFSNIQQEVQYAIRFLAIVQAFYFKYINQHGEEENEQRGSIVIYRQKFSKIYNEKYCRIEQAYKIGNEYEIQHRHMIECLGEGKKGKSMKKLILLEDIHNFIIIQPNNDQPTAKILVNNPWKYVRSEIDRDKGSHMTVSISHCVGGPARIQLFFADQARCVGTLEWMNKLKYERYQSEQAFILAYVKDCLSTQ